MGPFKPAGPSYTWSFPSDHGTHQDYKTEWWYLTGHLEAADGRRFGYQLTFFRVGVDRRSDRATLWAVRDVFPAHFAITDVSRGRFMFGEKVNRGAPGIAGAIAKDLNVWNENWSLMRIGNSFRARASMDQAELNLDLSPSREVTLHGTNGYSRKGKEPTQASMYYSITEMGAKGRLRIDETWFEVSGTGWLDHEFGSNQLSPEQVGWDWFSIQLDSGDHIMLYRLRRYNGEIEPQSSGTLILKGERGRRLQHLTATDFSAKPSRTWSSPRTGTIYPIDWSVEVPSLGLNLQLNALVEDQELVTLRSTGIAYWEGAVQVTGSWRDRPVAGRGYVELTGYEAKHRPKM